MKRDVKVVSALTALSLIIAIVCAVIGSRERFQRNFTVSEENMLADASGLLTLIFGFATLIGCITALVMHFDDREFDESLDEQ